MMNSYVNDAMRLADFYISYLDTLLARPGTPESHERIREAEENRPENSRNKESRKKHPECTVTLSKQPAAKPGGHRIAHEETCERPRRFIQFHAQIRDNGPGERKVQKEAPPRVWHLGEARRGAVPYFV